VTVPPPSRLHRGARIEDTVTRWLAGALRRRGWRPHVVPSTGYGSAATAEADGWVRVLARVKLSPSSKSLQTREGGRWWRMFFTVAVADLPVTVQLGQRSHEVRSGRGGYLDVVLASDLGPGWHDVSVSVTGRPEAHEFVRVVGPDERWGLVSDIDDTVMITALPRPLLAFWNTFVVKETKRRPVPGMAALYHRLRTEEPDALVVYLSTGAWNVARAISRFLNRHGYPRGPLLMTDWGPTTEGWFRSGQAHKRGELRRLVRDFPQLRWVLVGDDGQHDPQLYEELADEMPEAVRMVLIRELTAVEQVLTHGTPVPPDSEALEAPSPVPWMRGPDGEALAAQLR
jgi:phosphatidate phosphatase APP1